MQTLTNKIETSTTLNKLLNYKKIVLVNGKEFSIQLERSKLYFQASENYKLQETKDEFKKLNIEFNDKYDYFSKCFGTAKSWTATLIRCGGYSPEILADYLNSTKNHDIKGLDAFAKGDKAENTTTEGITEKTETEKPAKFSTTKKGIDIKINSGVTLEDINEAIQYLQSLQK